MMQLRIFRQAYVQAKGVIFNTEPERRMANRFYDFTYTEVLCVGLGMESKLTANPEAFRRKYQIDQPFLLYAGRKPWIAIWINCCNTTWNTAIETAEICNWC